MPYFEEHIFFPDNRSELCCLPPYRETCTRYSPAGAMMQNPCPANFIPDVFPDVTEMMEGQGVLPVVLLPSTVTVTVTWNPTYTIRRCTTNRDCVRHFVKEWPCPLAWVCKGLHSGLYGVHREHHRMLGHPSYCSRQQMLQQRSFGRDRCVS